MILILVEAERRRQCRDYSLKPSHLSQKVMRRHKRPEHMITQVIGWSLYGGLTMTSGLQGNSPASHSMTDVPQSQTFVPFSLGRIFLVACTPLASCKEQSQTLPLGELFTWLHVLDLNEYVSNTAPCFGLSLIFPPSRTLWSSWGSCPGFAKYRGIQQMQAGRGRGSLSHVSSTWLPSLLLSYL